MNCTIALDNGKLIESVQSFNRLNNEAKFFLFLILYVCISITRCIQHEDRIDAFKYTEGDHSFKGEFVRLARSAGID